MNAKKLDRELIKLNNKMSLENRGGDFNRARSFAVGTSFGGTTEVLMRMNDGRTVWATLQPVEVIEFIHQLAANVGCHIHIQPRRDFSSWRNWKHTEEELAHYRGVQPLPGVGHPPHANDMAPHQHIGQNLPAPEHQPGLQPALMARSNENEQTVATQETVRRKRTKRAAAAA